MIVIDGQELDDGVDEPGEERCPRCGEPLWSCECPADDVDDEGDE